MSLISQSLSFSQLLLGMKESYIKKITDEDIVAFAKISGDFNPIHLDEEFAAKSQFGTRIAHGLYTASLISTLIGVRLPGYGAIYLSQNLKFIAPVKIDEIVEACVEVIELISEKNRVRLKCSCTVKSHVVLEGEALVKVIK